MPDGDVTFEVRADSSQAEQTINKLLSQMKSSGGDIESALSKSFGSGMDKLTSKATNAAKSIAGAFTAAGIGSAVMSFAKDAVQAASSLEEVQNVVDVTFGASAGEINAWAQNASSAFGLTETQAKQFASTMGAMMKSSGLAGNEITKMSTDLAGLAADMASFYNMDFETAFQKIRSGISGETEPLKQLGINLSAANLEAFRLAQGLETAYSAMSQGEQVTLRYQYLMQATADAQGDFARTSDGFANGLRMLETNTEQFKANVGAIILPAVSSVIGAINEVFAAFQGNDMPETALDKFANIDLKTDEKLKQIRDTKQEALALVNVLREVSGETVVSDSMTTFVDTLTEHFGDLGEAVNKAKADDYAGTISAVAGALSTELGGSPEEWEKLLTAVADNAPKAGEAVSGEVGGELAAFLSGAAHAAADLGDGYADMWAAFLGVMGSDAPAAIQALQEGKSAADAMSAITGAAGDLSTDGSDWKTLFENLATDTSQLNSERAGEISGWMRQVSRGASELDPNAGGNWASLGEGLGEIPGNLGSDRNGPSWIKDVAKHASDLKSDAGGNWASLGESLTTLAGVGKLDETTRSWLGDVAKAAKDLKSGDVTSWNGLIRVINEMPDGADSQTKEFLTGVRDAAVSLKPDDVAGFQTLESTLNAGLTTLTAGDAKGTQEFIAAIGDAIGQLEPGDVEGFNALMDNLAEGLPEVFGTEEGRALIAQYKQLASDINGAADYSEAEDATEGITKKQQQWLDVCGRLVSALPGLSGIINDQTGEIEGGTQAVEDYVKAWAELEKTRVLQSAHEQKGQALETSRAELEAAKTDLEIQTQTLEALKASVEAAGLSWSELQNMAVPQYRGSVPDEYKDYLELYKEFKSAQIHTDASVSEQESAIESATKAYELEGEAVDAYAESVRQAAEAQDLLTGAMKEQAESAVSGLGEGLAKLAEYYEDVRNTIASGVAQNIGGFSSDGVTTAADKAKAELKDLRAEFKKTGDQEINLKITGIEEALPSAQNMAKALQDQLDYMQRYEDALAAARVAGVSDEVLSQFSSGSTEDLDYLEALASATPAEAETINQAYQDVIAKREEFVNTLTNNQLNGDEVFQGMVDEVNASMEELTTALGSTGAPDAAAQTMDDIVAAVQSRVPGLSQAISEVAGLVEQLNSLSGGGFGYSSGGGWFGLNIDGSHATGLDYVPFDNYLAQLHEGESILTAEEAKVWREFKNGGAANRNNIDYDAMAGAFWDSAPRSGGNVYLDGQAVGRVINNQQADSLRSLQRSGWQG